MSIKYGKRGWIIRSTYRITRLGDLFSNTPDKIHGYVHECLNEREAWKKFCRNILDQDPAHYFQPESIVIEKMGQNDFIQE